ncbi:MAG: ferritin [Cyclobacteriaceae bacterium]|jgi:ferritin
MKDNLSLNRSISTETEAMLNNQIMMEAQASAHYLSMASWCDVQGYSNSAKFLYGHADEERMHMMKLFHYINDAGGHALQPEITGLKHSYDSLRQVFQMILEHEIKVTQSINEIVEHCYNVKDFATLNFMQWYVSEQREEEMLSRRALELFDIIGEEGIGLWTIDQEIGKLEEAEPGETGAA